jgi:cytochrome c5
MTMASKIVLSAVLLVFAPICRFPQGYSQTAQDSRSQVASEVVPKPGKLKSAIQKSHSVNEGERVFQQNCSRCHWAPDGFSSRISGTIASHMRVRAALSAHDEKELLRFLNP